jgi:hypothetical protein
VRAAAGEMMFAASRRDLHGTIASAGSEATGLAPPSRSSRAWEASRCASLGTASPMSFATNLHHQAVEYVQMLVLELNESVAQSKVKEQSPADRLQAFAQKTKLSTESTMLFEVLPLDGAPTRLRLPTGGGPRCLEHSPSDRWASAEFFAAKFQEIIF